eukprot:TRINITY_DN994_c1_g1_i1.p1 TRINITY_DN994_c1_g1~~TRINITY_DN994_c1_g1_i1.p1  ORF type:complete len:397 (-),score=104.98 TRINITY_DN994_c1_g1_i1:190-1380(-)
MKRVFGGSGGSGPPSKRDIDAAIDKRLFIGRLPPGTTEDELRHAYGTYGTLNEVKVLPDKGVGFVGFNSWRAAQQALLGTDGQAALRSCAGQPLAVFFSEKGASRGRGGGSCPFAKGHDNSRIFVGNLPDVTQDSDLKMLFESFGSIESANLLPAKGAKAKRCGFVNFTLWGEAMDAIEAMDRNAEAGAGDPITVVLAEPRAGGGGGGGGGGDYGFSAKRSREGSYSGGYGNNSFEGLKAAYIQAVEGGASDFECDDLHRQLLAARPSRGGFGGGRFSEGKGRSGGYGSSVFGGGGGGGGSALGPDDARLFVAGLPYEVNDADLRSLVDQVQISLPPAQCQVLECRVLPNKGIGYVQYSSWDAATQALEALDNRQVSGWNLPLRVKWATRKGGGGF